MTEPPLPPAHTLIWPTVRALRELGGSGTIVEITETVTALEGFTEEQQAIPAPRGNRTGIEYRLAWARTFGKNIGLLENADTDVWTLTKDGQQVDADQVEERKREYLRARRQEQASAGIEDTLDDDLSGGAEPEDDWRIQVLTLVRAMDPIAFERLSQRMLCEAGFSNVEVTARSGDGGIYGTGLYRLSLLSFPMAFQCKRYSGAVGPEKVREFRGSFAGAGGTRADHHQWNLHVRGACHGYPRQLPAVRPDRWGSAGRSAPRTSYGYYDDTADRSRPPGTCGILRQHLTQCNDLGSGAIRRECSAITVRRRLVQ
jgi:restriction system protein